MSLIGHLELKCETLKGKSNDKGKAYFISVQLPDALWEKKKNACSLLKKYKKKISNLPKDCQFKVTINNDNIYVNGVLEKPVVKPLMPEDHFPDADEQKEINKIKVAYSPPPPP